MIVTQLTMERHRRYVSEPRQREATSANVSSGWPMPALWMRFAIDLIA